MFLIAVEVGLGKAPEVWADTKRIIRFSAPTMLDLEEIYFPIAEDLFEDCPEDIRPVWRAKGRGHFYFPSTGSKLYLFGVDAKHYKKARGKMCHLAVPDEVGSCEPGHPQGIEHVVNGLLMPQTFGVNGRIVMPTTPPETPGHPSVQLRVQCQAAGAFYRRSIHETALELQKHFGEGIVDEYAREAGGRDSTTFKREYGCEEVVDEDLAAVPEFAAHRANIVREPTPPTHFVPLMAMDVGFDPDPTFAGFGYWDFQRAKLCIVGEVVKRRATTDVVASLLKAKEAELWPWAAAEAETDDTGRYIHQPWREQRRIPRRYSDTDLRLIADLNSMHGLKISATAKDFKEAQVNELRMFVKDGRIEISPKCVDTIRHLETTIWNKHRTDWVRTTDGHGDGVDMLLYMLRNAPRSLNPFPPKYSELDPRTHFIPEPEVGSQAKSPLGRAVLARLKRTS